MNTYCIKGIKFICSRKIHFLMGITILKYLLLFLIIFTGCLSVRIINVWSKEPKAIQTTKGTLNLYWVDTGITFMFWGEPTRNMKMGDNFSKHKIGPVIPDMQEKGQILIPMPSDKDLPRTEEGWEKLSSDIYKVLKERLGGGLKDGIIDFEIRTVQNINVLGYISFWERQTKVIKFIKAFIKALERIKKEVSSDQSVYVAGLWGSNGGNAASQALSELSHNPVNRGILFDARAWVSYVKKLYEKLSGNLTIVTTAGDAPTRSFDLPFFQRTIAQILGLVVLSDRMVAELDTSKDLKKELPELRVFYLNPEGFWNIFITGHLAAMSNKKLYCKEWTGNGFITQGWLTKGKLLEITGILNRTNTGIRNHTNTDDGDDDNNPHRHHPPDDDDDPPPIAIIPPKLNDDEDNDNDHPPKSGGILLNILSGIVRHNVSEIKGPISRLILGHACLATNLNNTSLQLFLSVNTEKDLNSWLKHTDKLLHDNPENPFALYLSADAQARSGNLSIAIQRLTKALDKKSNFAIAYNLRGVVYTIEDKTSDALKDFNTAIKLEPNFADAYYNRGFLYTQIGKTQEALTDYTKAIGINSSGLAYNGRGIVYSQSGKYELAVDNLNAAKELIPDLAIIDGNIAIVNRHKANRNSPTSEMPKSFRISSKKVPQAPVGGVYMHADVVKSEIADMDEMLGIFPEQQTGLDELVSPFLIFPYFIGDYL